MASGQFFGGVASGFQKQEALNNQQNYEQGLLQLEQQRLQQEAKNKQRAEFMKLREQAISDMQNTVAAVKNAHPDWTESQVLSFPALAAQRDQLSGFDKNLGLDPNSAGSLLAGMAAGKSQIETEGALARAKEGPQHRDFVESEIQKNRAAAGLPIDTNNPDRPGTGANGPALGQKTSFNDRFSGQQFAQQGTTDATALSWADARSRLSEKYDPNLVNKAELWLKGNPGVVSGLRGGRGSEREKIQNVAMELARLTGTSPDQINQNFVDFKGRTAAATASGRTAGTRITNLDMILRRADANVDAAIAASDAVPRSDFVPLNSGVQWVAAKFSNEALKVFQQKNLAIAEDWAKSMNPTGVMRIEDRNLALDVLNTAIGRGTYAAAAHAVRDTIGLELTAAKKYLKERGFSSEAGGDNESSGSEPGPGGVRVHGFTFTPTGQ